MKRTGRRHLAIAGLLLATLAQPVGAALKEGDLAPDRTTFVVTPEGRIVATIGGVSPVENVEKALATVKQLLSD